MAAAKTKAKGAKSKASTKKSSTRKSGNGGFSLRELTDKQKVTLGKRIIAMRKKDASWDEITEATGVPGGITGRKLMRLAGGTGAESAIRAGSSTTRKSGKAKAKPKTTSKRGKAAGSTTRAKARGTKAKGGTTGSKTRRKGKAKSGN